MEKQLLSKEAINDLIFRINSEEFSSRLYEDMYHWFENKGYKNLASLYKKYSDEELVHAGFAKDYLLAYGIKPLLKAIQSPEAEYSDCKSIFEATLTHELQITRECEDLAKNALKRGEITLYTLGLKYCSEQIEEVSKSINLLDIHALTGDGLVLDQYVGETLLN